MSACTMLMAEGAGLVLILVWIGRTRSRCLAKDDGAAGDPALTRRLIAILGVGCLGLVIAGVGAWLIQTHIRVGAPQPSPESVRMVPEAGLTLAAGILLTLLLVSHLLATTEHHRLLEAEVARRTEALRESEARYRAIVETQTELVCRYRPEDGTLTFVNDAYRRFFSRSRASLIGTCLLDLIPASSRPRVRAIIDRMMAAPGRLTSDHEVLARDGEVRRQQWVDTPVFDDLGRLYEVQGVGRDITDQKRLETELRLFKAIVETSNEAIAVSDPDGALVYINPAHERLFGHPFDEAVGLNYRDYYPPESIETLDAAVAPALAARGTWEGVLDAFHADGRRFPLWERADILMDDHGRVQYSFWLMHDVSRDQAMQQALHESRERLDLALAGADLGTWDWDIPTGEVFFDERLVAMLGYTPDMVEPNVRFWEGLIHPDDRESVMAVLNAHLAGETGRYESEHRLRHRAGHWIWVLDRGRVMARDPDGKPLRACGTHLDITLAKQMEAALMESEARYRSFVENFPGIAFQGHSDYRPIFMHGAVETITGYAESDFGDGGLRWDELVFPDDRDILARTSAEVLGTPGRSLEREYRLVRRDQTIRWVRETIQNVCNDEGQPCFVQGVIYDVTDQKRAEVERRDLERQAARVRRMQSLNTMAGAVAHHFNNLLAVVLGDLEMAELDLPESASVREHIDRARTAAQRATEISRLMLTYVGQSGERPQWISPTTALADFIMDVRATVPAGVTLSVDIPDALPAIQVAPQSLHQAILSLITNAVEAMDDDGGEVRFSATVRPCKEVVEAADFVAEPPPGGDCLWLTVSDTGRGMDPETMLRLFDPFFTTKFIGRGLGMATVLGIVRCHGGTVAVTSTPGRGTAVSVLLPFASGDS